MLPLSTWTIAIGIDHKSGQGSDMDDEQFIKTLNRIAAEKKFRLPEITESPPSGDTIEAWAGFLQLCVKRGIKLSDPCWERVTVSRIEPVTVFELPGAAGRGTDDDFKVGLQLLMGMLDTDGSP
jgi:hypothetical protein